MERIAEWLLPELGRTTLALAIVGLTLLLLMKLLRLQSPLLHRAACYAPLLLGWAFWQMPVEVPWYAAALPAEQAFDPPVAVEPSAGEGLAPVPVAPGVNVAAADGERSPMAQQGAPEVKIDDARIAWPLVGLSIWLTGIVVAISYAAFGYLRFMGRLPAEQPADPAWLAQWDALRAEQGGANIQFRATECLGPMLCRLPRGYTLLVPAELWRTLGPAQRQSILRHELAHYRRGDVWKSLAVRLLALPHWFNPVAWLCVRRFDEAAEWACDEAAASGQPTDYARVLLHLSETAVRPSHFGAAMSARPLAARIRRLAALSAQRDSRLRIFLVAALLVAMLGVSLVRVQLVAEEPENGSRPAQYPTGSVNVNDDPQAPRIPPAVRAAQEKMAKYATEAYEAFVASYQSGNTTYDYVPYWSHRWLAAELELAQTREQQIAAAKAHLERMRQHRDNVEALYKTGSRGGEANIMRAFNYYVAEAERKLAEIEAPRRQVIELPNPVEPTASPEPTSSQEPPAETAESLDLQIKIAELEGQAEELKLQLAHYQQAASRAPGVISHLEIERTASRLESVKTQLDLHRRKLELYRKTQAAENPHWTPGMGQF